MAWFYLLLGGIFEIGWALGVKYSDGFTRPWISALTVLLVIPNLYFLSLAVREIPLGVAYVIWTSFGVVGTVVLGVALFGDRWTLLKIVFLILVVAGTIGLKVTSGTK